nr:FixH family protein [Brevibacillus laterosporus]
MKALKGLKVMGNTKISKNRLLSLLILSLCVFTLVGCGARGPKPDITAEFSSEPVPPKVGQQTILTAKLGGLENYDEVYVDIELKLEGQRSRELVKARQGETAVYAAKQKFSKPGTYDVTVHVYTPELHETVMKKITVE